MAKALINGGIITWARQRAEMDPVDLATSIHVKPEQISDWESGEDHPTFRQAQNLAKKLFIPFGYLFLTEPPVIEPQIADLRTVRDEQRNRFSLEFEDVLNDAQRKQNWYKEQLLQEGAQNLAFIGKFSITDNILAVAEDIQETLGINQAFRDRCTSWEDFLSKFIEKVEANGILVLRNGVVGNNNRRKLSVQEFRGFVLSDPIAPLIFINNNDTQAAKVFTLAHELAHLWIGESGVSDLDPGTRTTVPINDIERFCNKVAAEVLVPQQVFVESWDDNANLQANLNTLCRLFRVSAPVILIRAKTLNKISDQVFYQEYPNYNAARRRTRSSSGNFNNTLPVRNSKTLTRAIITSALEGSTLYRDAARLLGVKVSTLNSLASHLEIR
jgi:Zn-dependent peptidase ImmA (M78 family)/DNA-binding XRE family transcriptional regulator